MVPIPEYVQTQLSQQTSNFSLYFSRMVEWLENEDKMKDPQKIDNIGNLCTASSRMKNADKELTALHDRQTKLLLSLMEKDTNVFEFKAKLSSPFITGLGSGHPTETGMILDRNTGLPYIPSSSLKGVLRLAHSINLYENDNSLLNEKGQISDKLPSLRRFFGDTDTKPGSVRGQLVFLDVFPAEVPELKIDIMNPHFTNYYSGESANGPVETENPVFKYTLEKQAITKSGANGPVETENPVPIKFLTVKEGTEFVFRCYVSELIGNENEDLQWKKTEDEQAIEEMFKKALTTLGLGGKTSIGYGKFSNFQNTSTNLKEKIAQIKEQEKLEQEKRRSESLTPDERAKEKYLKEPKDTKNKLIGDEFIKDSSLSPGFFIWLKEQLIESRNWSHSTNPSDGGLARRCIKIQARIDSGT